MRRCLLLAGVLLLLAGGAVLLFHPVKAWLCRESRTQEIIRFQKAAQTVSKTQEKGEELREASKLYEEMEEYNRNLFETGQKGLVDAWSFQQSAFSLEEYHLETDVAGCLEIPAMNQKLPVYLGAAAENLEKGVAVLGQTSMPIGGESTNCVIAGHRGSGNDDLFREIQVLRPGDSVVLTNLWETLNYTVLSTQIILPDQLDVVRIQEGRDLLTLISCHPELEGTHRYVVFCSRDISEKPGKPAVEERESSSISEWKTDARLAQQERRVEIISQLEESLPFLAAPLVILVCGLIFIPLRKRKPRKR